MTTTQFYINKQVELNNSIVDASVAASEEILSAKSPVDALETFSNLFQSLTETVSEFVKGSAEDAIKTREELKAVIDDAIKLNSDYATKAVESSVETVKLAAKKAA